jgi:hypothetical protein
MEGSNVKRSVGRPRRVPPPDPLPRNGIVNTADDNTNIVELSYDNVSIFKKTFNLLKTMNVKEINFYFTENSAKIFGVDHLEKNIINIKLNPNKLNHYYCEKPINITLDTKNLDKITQKIDKNYELFSLILKKDSYRNNLFIILNNKSLSIDESHIIRLIENEYNLECLTRLNYDYNLYPLKFELNGKYFKKLINDIYIFSEVFTIEKIGNGSLQFVYKNLNNTIKGYNICKDNNKINLESNMGEDDIFSVSIQIDYVKSLSNSLLSEKVNIYADPEKDLVFNLVIDDGVMDITSYISINKYTN